MVLFGHTRNIIFGPFSDATSPGPAQYGLFYLGNFQNEAVICFFVISGYLVGGRVYVEVSGGRFCARDYIVARLSRLYIVLIPALLLTYGLAGAGYCTAASSAQQVASLFFLQAILVPEPTCNLPLWSLANEFWYYALALCAALLPAHRIRAAIAIGVAIALLSIDSIDRKNVLLYLPVWLIGAAVIASKRVPIARSGPWIGGVLFLAALAVSRSHVLDERFLLRDYLIAGTLFLLLCALRECKGTRLCMPKLGYRLASFSFTLYLVHFPILQAARVWLREIGWFALPLSPDAPVAYGVFFALFGFCILCAFLLAPVTEWQTDRLRKWIRRVLPGAGAGAGR